MTLMKNIHQNRALFNLLYHTKIENGKLTLTISFLCLYYLLLIFMFLFLGRQI